MREPDHEAIGAAKHTGGVFVAEENKWFDRKLFSEGPWLFAHGTDAGRTWKKMTNVS